MISIRGRLKISAVNRERNMCCQSLLVKSVWQPRSGVPYHPSLAHQTPLFLTRSSRPPPGQSRCKFCLTVHIRSRERFLTNKFGTPRCLWIDTPYSKNHDHQFVHATEMRPTSILSREVAVEIAHVIDREVVLMILLQRKRHIFTTVLRCFLFPSWPAVCILVSRLLGANVQALF